MFSRRINTVHVVFRLLQPRYHTEITHSSTLVLLLQRRYIVEITSISIQKASNVTQSKNSNNNN